MAQGLRAVAAFSEDYGLITRTHRVAHNYLVTPVQGNLIPSSGLLGHWIQCGAQT